MRTAAVAVMVLGACLTLQAAPPPSIDGSLSDPFWAIDARVWTVQDPERPANAARFLFGYDERFLYLAAEIVDRDVVGAHPLRKSKTWLDDSVEFYIDFGAGTAAERTPETWQYAFSAAGGVNWTRGVGDGSGRRYPAHDWPPDWNSELQWAVQLRPGTILNNAARIDTGYTVEARVPLQELGQTGPLRPDGSVGVNFVNIRRAGKNRDEGRPLSIVPGLQPEDFHNPGRWLRIRLDWQAPFAIRGLVLDLPLRPEEADSAFRWGRGDAGADWRNRDGWTAQLARMRKHGLNALLLNCANVDALRANPQAGGDHAADREHFRWILSEARSHGVRVYLTPLPVDPPRAAGARTADTQPGRHGPSETPGPEIAPAPGRGMRIPATWPAAPRPAIESAITAQAIADLLRAYPDLAGVALVLNPYDDIAAGPGETGKASAPQTRPAAHAARGEWLLDVARALAANGGRAATGEPQGPPGRSARGQELLVGVRDEPPELLARLMTIYPHVRLLHDFQERSWTSPQVDPRAARLGVEVASAGGPGPRAPVSGIAVGGPGCANRYLFWGDPAWMREVSLDLRRQGLDGMFLRPESEDPWLAVEAWGVYAFQSGDVFNQKRWQKRLEEVYGVGMYAGQLLEAARHASAIMPRLCSLVNGCSERYMPQLGLPLACSVGLPAATGARLRQPAAAATRPSAEGPVLPGQTPIASIPEEVNLQAPPGATGAEAIARAIGSDVAVCRSRLTGLRHVKPELPQQAAELGRLLDRIELNAALGEHYAHWIRAGLAWERYRTLRGPEGAYIADFQKAIEAWTALTAVANRLYPDPVPSWELRIASPPPWTREQIRRSYHPVYRHWRDHLGALDREMGWLRDQQGTDRPDSISLAAWDYLHALPPARLQGVSRITFTGINDRRYHLGAGGGPVDQEGISIRGPSLLLNTRGLGGGWHRVFETDPAAMPIPLGRPLEIVFLYRVLQPGTEDPEPFLAGIRKTPQGPILGDAPRWGAPVGHQGIRIIKIPPLQGGPHILTIDVLGEAAIVIDELRLEAMKFEP